MEVDMWKNIRISYRFGGLFFCMVLLIGFLLLAVVLNQFKEMSLRAENNQLRDLHKTIQARVNDTSRHALLVIDSVVNAPGVVDSFANKKRERLQQLTAPVFDSLRNTYNIRQFQFHLPPATSFLRLHDPERHGDDLSSFRRTVVRANELQKPQVGLERGVAGIGLRGVMPVMYNGNLVGSAEIGLSFGQDFFDDFSTEYQTPVALHLADTGGTGFTTFASTIPGTTTLHPDQFVRAFNNAEVVQRVSIGDVNYAVMAQPIRDFNNEIVGVVEVLFDRSKYRNIFHLASGHLLMIGMFSLLLVFAVIWLVTRDIVKPVQAVTSAAEAVCKGDAAQQLPDDGRKDEVGKLVRAVAQLIRRNR